MRKDLKVGKSQEREQKQFLDKFVRTSPRHKRWCKQGHSRQREPCEEKSKISRGHIWWFREGQAACLVQCINGMAGGPRNWQGSQCWDLGGQQQEGQGFITWTSHKMCFRKVKVYKMAQGRESSQNCLKTEREASHWPNTGQSEHHKKQRCSRIIIHEQRSQDSITILKKQRRRESSSLQENAS